ncbi:MAG: Rrf2 family transcriptional regulator [Firmicutes bacterium]|nr:Rrf2 family transcriptional regulator [Bacillota bacterium]
MQLTQATDYAFRAALLLAMAGEGEIVDAQTISSREKIPIRFLLKIMRSLVQAGIMKSHRGINGGFSLARPPREIALLDIVEAVEGAIRINRCLLDPDYCSKHWASHCPVHSALANIQAAIASEFSRYNLADLAGKA